ncbi:putative skeletal organic matrix protein 5 [Acropora palmata]|uniref:putative skeletal organic matrix protein 5 n=1 Tax=Acropora palmata TaxID=6131 RepID=UPI003DA0ADD6
MQSAYRFLAVIVLAVFLNDAFASADANQTPLASRGSVVCNLIQDSHVNAAIKNLETKLEILIALVNKTRPLQPAPSPIPASSCNEIFQKQRMTKSQVYTLMLGSRNIPVYCHMGDFGCGSGGWTPVMKTDGTKKTFHYSSHFWSDRKVYNLAEGKTGFEKQETKLPSYWETRFSKICLGMRSGSTTRFVVIRRSANSLYALIADGRYRALSLGRNKWKSLIGSQASLQRNCNKEGFNLLGGNRHSKARIGIVANQENNCLTCDSRIGFGTGGLYDDSNTCGNQATHAPDNGNKHIKAMGYILVQ